MALLYQWGCEKAAPVRSGRRLVFAERPNIAFTLGFVVATSMYFLTNRLLPLSIEDHPHAEIAVFFAIWFVAALHALMRPVRSAWIEQTLVAGALLICLPMLDVLTNRYSRNTLYSSVSALAILFGCSFCFVALHLRRRFSSYQSNSDPVCLCRFLMSLVKIEVAIFAS